MNDSETLVRNMHSHTAASAADRYNGAGPPLQGSKSAGNLSTNLPQVRYTSAIILASLATTQGTGYRTIATWGRGYRTIPTWGKGATILSQHGGRGLPYYPNMGEGGCHTITTWGKGGYHTVPAWGEGGYPNQVSLNMA